MPTIPAAKPSRPSTKFTALTVSTTIKTVSNTLASGSSSKVPSIGSHNTWMPRSAMEPAANTWPTNFVGASSPHRSSARPSSKMIVHPTINASG